MTGWQQHSWAERCRIGREVARARASKPTVPWKVLEERHGRTRHTLRGYEQESRGITPLRLLLAETKRERNYPNSPSERIVTDSPSGAACPLVARSAGDDG